MRKLNIVITVDEGVDPKLVDPHEIYEALIDDWETYAHPNDSDESFKVAMVSAEWADGD